MKYFTSLVTALLLMISSAAFAATSEKYGKGGWIQDFQPEIDRANASGELFRIRAIASRTARCFSACATSASSAAPRCCFMPATTASATSTPVSTGRMLNAYNAGLRQYVMDNHYMDTLAFHAIPGAMIIDKFGYKECPRK